MASNGPMILISRCTLQNVFDRSLSQHSHTRTIRRNDVVHYTISCITNLYVAVVADEALYNICVDEDVVQFAIGTGVLC